MAPPLGVGGLRTSDFFFFFNILLFCKQSPMAPGLF